MLTAIGSPRHHGPARLLTGLALALTAALVGASPASAASTISLSPSSVARGATVTISGSVPVTGSASCPAGDAVQLTSTAPLFPPDGFGPQAPRDGAGNFTVEFVVPSSTPAGSYSIGIRCGGGNVGVSASLQVTAVTATTTSTNATTATTTTTRPSPSTTIAVPTSQAPPTTTAPGGSGPGGHSRAATWIGLAALVVVIAGAAYFFRARRSPPSP